MNDIFDLKIRRANEGDVRAIAVIGVRSWQRAYVGIVPQQHLDQMSAEKSERGWLTGLGRGEFRAYVAEVNGSVVGFVTVCKSRDEDAPSDTAEVGGIYLLPEYWRKGIGKALWRTASEDAIESGATSLTAWLFEENTAARSFYEALGCTDTGARRAMTPGGTQVTTMRVGQPLPRRSADR